MSLGQASLGNRGQNLLLEGPAFFAASAIHHSKCFVVAGICLDVGIAWL